jgi:hypothetical protein
MKNFCEWLEKKDQKYFRTLIFKEQKDPNVFDIKDYLITKLEDGEDYYVVDDPFEMGKKKYIPVDSPSAIETVKRLHNARVNKGNPLAQNNTNAVDANMKRKDAVKKPLDMKAQAEKEAQEIELNRRMAGFNAMVRSFEKYYGKDRTAKVWQKPILIAASEEKTNDPYLLKQASYFKEYHNVFGPRYWRWSKEAKIKAGVGELKPEETPLFIVTDIDDWKENCQDLARQLFNSMYGPKTDGESWHNLASIASGYIKGADRETLENAMRFTIETYKDYLAGKKGKTYERWDAPRRRETGVD